MKLQRITQPRLAYIDDYIGSLDGREYLFRYTRDAFAGLEGELQPILSALEDLRSYAESRGATYAIVMVPTKFRVVGRLTELPAGSPLEDYEGNCSPLPGIVRDWAAKTGVPYLDLTEKLQEHAARGDVPWFPGDTHWNGEGNEAALEALLAWKELSRFFTR